MIEKQKIIVEEIAKEFINNALLLRYDICTCILCKQEMIKQIISKIPPDAFTANAPAAEIKLKYRAEFIRAVPPAIETVSSAPVHPLTEDRVESFKLLLNTIHEDRNLDFRQYNQGVIKRKVGYRMHMNGASSYLEYEKILRKNPDEYEKLLAALCINVSEFFRDTEIWVTLRYLFETLINKKNLKNDKSLRVWSAGCASGEEPYSLAILLREIVKRGMYAGRLEVFGTDIDKKCLQAAQIGRYRKDAIKNVDPKYLKKYFSVFPDGTCAVKDEIKNMVTFQYLDLIKQELLGDIDVILCRNVFIYFTRNLQDQLLMKFHKALQSGGYLIKGKAEAIFNEGKGYFEDVDANARIYRKIS